MYEIPTTITIDGKEYRIRNNGDYRMVLDCFMALQDTELTLTERIFASLVIFYADINSLDDIDNITDLNEAVNKMYEFFNCGQPQGVGRSLPYKLIDWKQDEQLVCSAINKVANTEIRFEKYLHWWTFMGYYTAIGESSLSTVLTIRNKIVKGKKLEKFEKEFKFNNPEYFAWNSKLSDDLEDDKLIKEMWNSGG